MAANRPATDLPGFYFDPEKNRYFRLKPGTNNHNPLTKDVIRKREDISKLTSPPKKHKASHQARPVQTSILKTLTQRSSGMNGMLGSLKYNSAMVKTKLKASVAEKIDTLPAQDNSRLVMGFLPNHHCSELLTLATMQSSIRDTEFATEITCLSKKEPSIIRLEMAKLGNICFVSLDSNRRENILFTKLNHSMVVLRHRGEWKYRSARTAFSCAAARSPNCRFKLSYSDGKRAILVSNACHFWGASSRAHPRGGAGFTVRTLPGDVMSQCFGYSPHLHYNGIRSGAVITLDLRLKSQTAHAQTMLPSSRCNATRLQALSDEFGLLAGYTVAQNSPTVYLWDTRFTTKPVHQYCSDCVIERYDIDGLPHDHVFQLNIDKEEQVLTSVFPDLKARLWSIKTAELIRTYPDESNNGVQVTAAAYSQMWPMLDKQPGGVLVHVHGKGKELLAL